MVFVAAGVRDRSASGSGIYMGFMGVIIKTRRVREDLFHWVVVHNN